VPASIAHMLTSRKGKTMFRQLTLFQKTLFAGLIIVALVAATAAGVAIWWAKTVVGTAETQLAIEKSNVATLKTYADRTWKALDQQNAEVERLRKECERLRQSATPKHESTPQ